MKEAKIYSVAFTFTYPAIHAGTASEALELGWDAFQWVMGDVTRDNFSIEVNDVTAKEGAKVLRLNKKPASKKVARKKK